MKHSNTALSRGLLIVCMLFLCFLCQGLFLKLRISLKSLEVIQQKNPLTRVGYVISRTIFHMP